MAEASNKTKFNRNFINTDAKTRVLGVVNDKYYHMGMLIL